MIGYLPEVYPDELFYSWVSRKFVHSGHALHSAVLREFFCKRSDNPSKEFLGHLNEDALKVIRKVIPLRELILQHTMVPQYARFIPLAEKQEALHRMEHDYCDPHFLFPVLIRNEEDAFLRYCPACAQEDRETYGETYWHRKHQLRGARVCYKHGCWLEQSTVSAKSEQGFTLCPAEEYAVIDSPRYCDNPELQRYTRFISDVFDAPMGFERDIPISAVLYNAMIRTDYMKRTGRSRHTQRFADDLRTYYEGIGLSGIASISQIQKTLLMGHTECKGLGVANCLDLLSRAIIEGGGKHAGGIKVSYNLNHVILLSYGTVGHLFMMFGYNATDRIGIRRCFHSELL